MELATGYPGYNGRMPFENGMLPEILLENGYNTFCVGKWHLSPSEDKRRRDRSTAGPWVGGSSGSTDSWVARRTSGIRTSLRTTGRSPAADPGGGLPPERGPRRPRDPVHLDAQVNAPEKPFYMYYATGAAHAPHHVPKEWADKYKGKFDNGWDVYRETVFERRSDLGLMPDDAELSRHDPDVPERDTLTDDERRVYSRMMEVYAGFVSTLTTTSVDPRHPRTRSVSWTTRSSW